MLARARARLARGCPQAAGQVDFRHGTQAALRPAERFDVLITFFLLDCIAAPELTAALTALRGAQRAGAPWLLADFRPARRGWRRWLLAAMYWFFRLTTGLRAYSLPDLRTELDRLGLQPQRTATFFGRAMEGVVFTESGS